MPWAPQGPCPTRGCRNLTSGGPCAECVRARHKRYDQTRPSSSKRGYGLKVWKVLRSRKLDANPWCEECLRAEVYEPATDVDHLEAHTGPDDPRFLDWANLSSKCKACHSRKTATVDSNFSAGRKGAV